MKKYKYKQYLKNGELEKVIRTNNLDYIIKYRKSMFDESGALYMRYFQCKETINGNKLYLYGL